MRILTVLTYYRPHTSGLTIYAERMGRAFARRGHQVTVFTSQFDKTTAREESKDGVHIVRSPVALRISKGVIMPWFGAQVTGQVWRHDVVHLHLPQFDAPGVAFRARLMGKPVVLTYHCDLTMPAGLLNRAANQVIHFQNAMAGMLADHIVTYTQDYADHSPYLSRYKHKLTPILPPVELPPAGPGAIEAFGGEHRVDERRPVIGMAARFASEKGVEILLDALPAILESYPRAQVLFAGQHEHVFAEQLYAERLMPRLRKYEAEGHWKFLGVLNPEQMAAYYPNLDALVVPSLNSTEAFGLVQIEAMMNNVPCVASALPGVRQPVLTTGMGRVVPIGDSAALAGALLDIFAEPEKYRRDPLEIARPYNPDSVAAEYERLFETLAKRNRQ
jgi:glycosyltransferase involved in cell wall biosynthesis